MPYRILSLDGGGTWAMIQAEVLRDIYGDRPGREILQQFDMAIANSGGSMVLACLCNNMQPSQITKIFQTKEDRDLIFSKLHFIEKLTRRNWISLFRAITDIGPKYKATRKYSGLEKLFQKYTKEPEVEHQVFHRRLTEIPALIDDKKEVQLLIVGYDYFKRRSTFFRSNAKSKTNAFGNADFDITLGEAIHCSSDAPVNYFDAPADVKIWANGYSRNNWYWDGGVSGFNNPVLAGLTEAITNEPNLSMEDFHILSIGTGTGSLAVITDYEKSTYPPDKEIFEKNKNNPLVVSKPTFKFLNDVQEMATSILADPPDSATFITYCMLNRGLKENGANLVRINPCLQPELDEQLQQYFAPRAYKGFDKEFIQLVNMDMDATEDWQVALITGLCEKFIKATGDNALPNQLIRGAINTKHIGDISYAAAKKRWDMLK